MPYIGRPQESGTYKKLDDISSQFNGTLVTFNLTIGGAPVLLPIVNPVNEGVVVVVLNTTA